LRPTGLRRLVPGSRFRYSDAPPTTHYVQRLLRVRSVGAMRAQPHYQRDRQRDRDHAENRRDRRQHDGLEARAARINSRVPKCFTFVPLGFDLTDEDDAISGDHAKQRQNERKFRSANTKGPGLSRAPACRTGGTCAVLGLLRLLALIVARTRIARAWLVLRSRRRPCLATLAGLAFIRLAFDGARSLA
jgi:hypothetical protein